MGFWAVVTVTAATMGYIINRTGGNLKDCADEHNITCFIEVKPVPCRFTHVHTCFLFCFRVFCLVCLPCSTEKTVVIARHVAKVRVPPGCYA